MNYISPLNCAAAAVRYVASTAAAGALAMPGVALEGDAQNAAKILLYGVSCITPSAPRVLAKFVVCPRNKATYIIFTLLYSTFFPLPLLVRPPFRRSINLPNLNLISASITEVNCGNAGVFFYSPPSSPGYWLDKYVIVLQQRGGRVSAPRF